MDTTESYELLASLNEGLAELCLVLMVAQRVARKSGDLSGALKVGDINRHASMTELLAVVLKIL
jgi:hypothetical protein